MERSPIADRIEQLIELKELSIKEISELLGVQRSSLSHILSGRNKPSLDFILKVLSLYPDINEKWLLHGKGKPYKDEELERSPAKVLSNAPAPPSSTITPVTSNNFTEVTHRIGQNTTDVNKEDSPVEKTPKSSITSSLTLNSREIQQVMVLYKDGSFEVYTPRPHEEE